MKIWSCRYVHFSLFMACSVLFSLPTVILGDEVAPAQEDTKPADGDDPLSVDEQDEYYELMKLFVDAMDEVERNYVRPISRRELVEAAIEGVLSKLDTYSDYIAPDDVDAFRQEMESEFGGIGIQIGGKGRNGPIVVITPLVGTPAYRAGLMPGDKIIMGSDGRDDIRLTKGAVSTSDEERFLACLEKAKGGFEDIVTEVKKDIYLTDDFSLLMIEYTA